jgi:uncharacterized repeat protein (TIGR01451 family)
MKKILASLTIALIFVSMLPILAPKASAMEEAAQTQRTPVPPLTNKNRLQVVIEEDVTVQENGLSQMTLLINVPSSLLAEMYQKTLGSPDTVDDFCRSLERQQSEQLGLVVNITELNVTPKSDPEEFTIWLRADALLPIISVSDVGLYDEWKIAVGPKDGKAAAESALTNIQFVQMMLESITGKQEYESVWKTRFEFPDSASIMNENALSKLSWKVSFSFNSYMTAAVFLQGTSTLVLEEKTIIAEEEITATSDYIFDMLGQYRIFQIELFVPDSASVFAANQNTTCVDDWRHDFTLASWGQTMPIPFEEGVFKATLTASASFQITGQIGWEFDWHGLKSFWSWMQFEATLGLKLHAEVTASYSNKWTHPFADLPVGSPITVIVPVGPIPFPVTVNVKFGAVGSLNFDAFGSIKFDAETTATGSFKAGVEWSRESGWKGIQDQKVDWSEPIPKIEAEAGVSVRAGLACKLKFLFYDQFGPFVEFEPYATATATFTYPPPEGTWEITANLRVAAGVTFGGILKDLLGLKDWSTTLFDKQFRRWSGTWEYSGIFSDDTPPGTPGTPVANALLSTTGDITWTWAAASEDVGVIVQYHVQVGTSAGSSNILDGYVGTSLSKTMYSLLGGHTYYARVRAKNAAGLWGSWSDASEGAIVDRPPVTIISQGPSGMTCKDDVTFSWTGTDDVTPAANLLYSYYLEGYDSGWSSWTATTTKGYANLPTGSTYTFKVTAKDQRGTADPTPAERTFTIDPRPLEFANAIVVDQDSLIDASIEGDIRAFHVFTSPVGFLSSTHGDTFLIMSTGIAENVPGNPEDFESTDFGAYGTTDDTVSFTLKFLVPDGASTLSFDFRFMSEEYPEYVGSAFNDFFAANFGDSAGARQVAFDDNGNIINVNNNFFNPNIYPIGTVFDGATKRLTTIVEVTPNEIVYLQFQVGDVGDGIFDTAVFLDNVRFNVGPAPPGTTPTADVIVVKNGPNSVEKGHQFAYTINYFNIEEGTAQNVVVVDNLPSQVTFVSASSGGTYSSSTHSVTWNLGTLSPFSSGSLILTVFVPSTTSVGTVLQNSASITTTSQESNSDNNQYIKTTTVTTGASLPPNVEVGPIISNYNGIPVLYWTTPTTFTYHGDANVIGVDINIHLPDGGPDIGGPMTNIPGTYDWTFTYTFYPRHGQGIVTYTVHYAVGDDTTATHNILVDPSGYVYNSLTGQRISGATVTLLRFDVVLQQFVVVDPNDLGIDPHINPQTTDENGGYGWMVSPGIYMVRVEKEGYETNFAIVAVPPPATDLNIPLTPIDITPPTTQIIIGQPHYIDPSGNTYVTSATSFTLTADDGPDGSGVASTSYRIYNSSYDTGWLQYSTLFYITGLSDGEYSIDYYSTDTIGNTESPNTATVILDNTPPTTMLTIGKPKYISDKTYVTPDTPFTLEATDTGSGVYSIAYRIYNTTYNSGWQTYANPFKLISLAEGTYTIEYNSTDNVGNVETTQAVNVVLGDYLTLAIEEINFLRSYATQLYMAKSIGKNEYNHFIADLNKVQKEIEKATKNLNRERHGYDDKMAGFENLRHSVMKLKHMIKDVQDWQGRGRIPQSAATTIIKELEIIRMKLMDKARAEAEEEKALALKAIQEAKALGKDTRKAEEEMTKANRELAKAEQCISKGKLAQAIQHFKHAFAHSHHAIKKAYDPTWFTDYKDWIDELEEEIPKTTI